MPIDVFSSNDQAQKRCLYQIDLALLDAIAPALAQLKAKTGAVFDPYATTQLHRDHYRLLAKNLPTGRNVDKRVTQFANFLDTCTHETLILVGD